jgi:hypothetical protein
VWAQLWKEDLQKQNPKAAESLADPAEYPNLFPELQQELMESPMAMDEVRGMSQTHATKRLPCTANVSRRIEVAVVRPLASHTVRHSSTD